MRIVHGSDWHGDTAVLPAADLYVFTGDMLPNFPLLYYAGRAGSEVEWRPNVSLLGHDEDLEPQGNFIRRVIDPAREARLQAAYLEYTKRVLALGQPYGRTWLGTPGAPVVVCRGNHDFVDLAPWFGPPVYEIGAPETAHEVLGLKVGGCRGINYIVGEWADELQAPAFADRVRALPPDLDVLVTHSPALTFLDLSAYRQNVGSAALAAYVSGRGYGHPLRAHFFGHVHEAAGLTTVGTTVFSNAAQRYNVLEL